MLPRIEEIRGPAARGRGLSGRVYCYLLCILSDYESINSVEVRVLPIHV